MSEGSSCGTASATLVLVELILNLSNQLSIRLNDERESHVKLLEQGIHVLKSIYTEQQGSLMTVSIKMFHSFLAPELLHDPLLLFF